MSLVASTPGKLVLLGEYAVLEGAPAIVMAVDRRARARVAAGAAGVVRAPDVWSGPVLLGFDDRGRPTWPGASAEARQAMTLVDQVLQGLAADAPAPLPPIALDLDTREFFDRAAGAPRKLGLGSSAALTVALASAVAAQTGRGALLTDRGRWLAQLLDLHRRFQGGRGSGVDVAAAVHGGTLAYRMVAGQASAEPLAWPMRLLRRFVWSGRSASTSAFLGRLAAWRASHSADYAARFERLAAIAEQAVAAIRAATPGSFLAAARAYSDELRDLGQASGVEIWSDEHRRIAAIAEPLGCLYKPCGAGGGDVGVAFAVDDPQRLSALQAQLKVAGFECVDLAEDVLGLDVETMETAEA